MRHEIHPIADDAVESFDVVVGVAPDGFIRQSYENPPQDAFFCDKTREWVAEAFSRKVEMYNGEIWADLQFRRHGAHCKENGKNYPLHMHPHLDEYGPRTHKGPPRVSSETGRWEAAQTAGLDEYGPIVVPSRQPLLAYFESRR